MTDGLAAFVERSLAAPIPAAARTIAATLAGETGAIAALFYGSNLRTGSLDGVLDFYLLMPGAPDGGMWPTVGYREIAVEGQVVRVKIAVMTLATFARAAAGGTIDTTVWTRFVQPAALAWVGDPAVADRVVQAVADAAVSAGRFAAALGPVEGTAGDYWRALFRQTYAAELRVEASGREEQLLAHGGDRYDILLPLAWVAGGIGFERRGDTLRPALDPARRARLVAAWRRRRRWGKPLNIARLVRAAFTFDGAAAYAAWKIERHTGVGIALTPWRERHPLLAAPGVAWQVWRRAR